MWEPLAIFATILFRLTLPPINNTDTFAPGHLSDENESHRLQGMPYGAPCGPEDKGRTTACYYTGPFSKYQNGNIACAETWTSLTHAVDAYPCGIFSSSFCCVAPLSASLEAKEPAPIQQDQIHAVDQARLVSDVNEGHRLKRLPYGAPCGPEDKGRTTSCYYAVIGGRDPNAACAETWTSLTRVVTEYGCGILQVVYCCVAP